MPPEVKNVVIEMCYQMGVYGFSCFKKTIAYLQDKKWNSFDGNLNDKQRATRLLDFSEGRRKILISMKVLDEGIDIPSAKTAIILASSGNPRQFIQRRGRILRKSDKTHKPYAHIYDFIVVPNYLSTDPKTRDIEIRIFNNELRRIEEFCSLSMNRQNTDEIVSRIRDEYNF